MPILPYSVWKMARSVAWALEHYSQERNELLAQSPLTGRALCEKLADLADELFSALASEFDPMHWALMAVGSYGTRTLCPGSDLDVILLSTKARRNKRASGRTTASEEQAAAALWYPLWDAGIRLDYSVKSIPDALAVAEKDLRAMLSLLEARLVWGDPKTGDELISKARKRWHSKWRVNLQELRRACITRHERYGDLAFLLEGDLKEAHGGLRDIQAARAAVRLLVGWEDETITEGLLRPQEDLLLEDRVELHRITGRSEDRLLLQEQDEIAARLGVQDADVLMARVSEAARFVAWSLDELLDRLSSKPRGTMELLETLAIRRAATTTVLPKKGTLDVRNNEANPRHPSLSEILHMAVQATRSEGVLPGKLLSQLEEFPERNDPGARPQDPWPDQLRSDWVELLLLGSAARRTLETLEHFSLLEALIPEWQHVRNLPQRNAYHRFTVDRHLIECAIEGAKLLEQGARCRRPDLLVTACLLHDIGKGLPGNHSESGAHIARQVARRMGFEAHDVEVIGLLTANHLLLADTATRRDLDDPKTVELVADLLGDYEVLDLLWLLTKADGLATGPAAWTPWKEGLVQELVGKVRRRFAGQPLPNATVKPGPREMELLAAGKLALLPEGNKVTVIAPDRPGLLASVAGVLSLHGLDVSSADVISLDSVGPEPMALEVFSVHPVHGRWPEWPRVESDLHSVLEGRIDLARHLAERAERYRKPVASPSRTIEVSFDDAASERATVIDVRAPDRPGQLHRLASAITACGLNVVAARVTTIGQEAMDAFYVQDPTGGLARDPSTRARVVKTLTDALSNDPRQQHHQKTREPSCMREPPLASQ